MYLMALGINVKCTRNREKKKKGSSSKHCINFRYYQRKLIGLTEKNTAKLS